APVKSASDRRQGHDAQRGTPTRRPRSRARGSRRPTGAVMATPLVLQRPPGWIRSTPLWLLPLPAAWVAYVLSFNPTDRIPDPTGPCLWHRLFGIDGPSCGITRMTWYLLHGDLLDAARMHLAAFVAVQIGRASCRERAPSSGDE